LAVEYRVSSRSVRTAGEREWPVKKRVYIETTIVSYLTAKPSRERIMAANQEITREWWKHRRNSYDLYTSQFVLDEAGDGDPEAAKKRLDALDGLPLLDASDDTMQLAEELVRRRLLPARAATDAVHLVVATLNRIDVLLTWNCRHLANADIYVPISRFLRSRGHEPSLVCVPAELMGPGDLEE
jgi:hypothetical protein